MSTQKIIITEEDIKSANAYVPIQSKVQIAQLLAPICVSEVGVACDLSGEQVPIPPRYQENELYKQLLCMGVFVDAYLQKPVSWVKADDGREIRFFMPSDIYDIYGSNQIFNQLERLKGNPKIRDKIFDMLSDYKEWVKILNTEIYSLLGHKNDICGRILELITSQASSDALIKMQNEAEDLQKTLESIEKRNAPAETSKDGDVNE